MYHLRFALIALWFIFVPVPGVALRLPPATLSAGGGPACGWRLASYIPVPHRTIESGVHDSGSPAFSGSAQILSRQ